MNITKTMAEQTANKMVEPITKKIKELKNQLNQIAYEAIIPTIPQDVLDCFKKHRSYFMTPYDVYVCHGNWKMLVQGLPLFPGTKSLYPDIQIGIEDMERLRKLETEIKEIKEEKEKTIQSIVATLMSLRTIKRVKEGFPEAYKHMEEYSEEKCTAIALPIKDILFSLNKYALTVN
ncbi:Nmad5 family putative nucleotide modification protein [Bacteroides salyersiae]|uniref:Nucleotide modification associated domain-containing protein n=1 Tax=Bacteroides salyersiae TaxID=291644 RepID=A0A7J4XM04_9BACE|nr:Nmad5 family putative nucleotide modification protein [Bacteroides salyersiae]KAA3691699.1 hypothetical protein F3F88_19160 [Bacteroides salyersiae]KAA3694857.1 hypothetical protein F3F90_02730 [Bacteroides salyersiae]KAA3698089.1 hypothetical protein F3F89_06755 [Bacteroides salyersiae]KAA3704220.1 hypothetical protein F3F83_17590 [Bacteroides salyersiae]KAA3713405.1 hypothetical protein F3G09_06980 [Bacteroides salyersiae]